MKYFECDDGVLYCGDSKDILKKLPDNSVTAIVTDPPYGLSFMGKKWDYDVPSKEMFTEMLRVLKPGGTMLCFAGSRTQHRMAVNVEDAGFILKDTIMWIYGSGFPKATDISKQLDKGHGRKVVSIEKTPYKVNGNAKDGTSLTGSVNGDFCKQQDGDGYRVNVITEPSTTKAKLWNGWKSHGLKPAYEPIIVAMKPNDKTYANNALVHGVAGLNIDGCRIGTDEDTSRKRYSTENSTSYGKSKVMGGDGHESGRFPANIIHDGSDEVVRLFPDSKDGVASANSGRMGYHGGKPKSTPKTGYGGIGSAARFFYCAKASKSERNAGCENLEEKLAPKGSYVGRDLSNPNVHLGGMQSSVGKNIHPTVKPISLMTYLTKLVKMPEETIILDPFAGSGSTLIACVRNNIKFIGIEMEAEYCEIAKCRVEHAIKGKAEEQCQIKLYF